MIGMGDPVGLPALYVMAVSFALFLVALFAARRRAGAEDAANATRSRRSQAGIAVQGIAIFITAYGRQNVALDPASAAAIVQAVVCGLLMALTIGLFVWASRTMGRNWSIVARTRADHQLVETGPFGFIRHPIYSALFLMMLALAIGFGHADRLWVTIPLYGLGTWLRISEEERLLRSLFGAVHDDYARRVKRFVPGLF